MLRHRGNSKIKFEHHMIQGLRELLEQIEPNKYIRSIIPGRIKIVGRFKPLSIKITQDTISGIKCIAQSGRAIQEVFIVATDRDKLKIEV